MMDGCDSDILNLHRGAKALQAPLRLLPAVRIDHDIDILFKRLAVRGRHCQLQGHLVCFYSNHHGLHFVGGLPVRFVSRKLLDFNKMPCQIFKAAMRIEPTGMGHHINL